jgi:hypothetical protein
VTDADLVTDDWTPSTDPVTTDPVTPIRVPVTDDWTLSLFR